MSSMRPRGYKEIQGLALCQPAMKLELPGITLSIQHRGVLYAAVVAAVLIVLMLTRTMEGLMCMA